MPSDKPARNPLEVQCGECAHRWVAAWLPMPIEKVAAICKGLRCPSCSAPATKVYMAAEPKPPESTAQ